jgi:peptide/nickel transport system substrate-binding protein
VTIIAPELPVTLNPLLNTQRIGDDLIGLIFEGLTTLDDRGERVASLATQVPTLQNGGVSADGKRIVYQLRDGVKFADGSPLNCEDVRFTWQARLTAGVGVVSKVGYQDIESVECPAPTQVTLNFRQTFAAYLTLFDQILPRGFGNPLSMQTWKVNQTAYGTGAFKVNEYRANEFIRLARNEFFHEKGKPYLDQIVIIPIADATPAVNVIKASEADIIWSVALRSANELQAAKDIALSRTPRIGAERLFLNLAQNKDGGSPDVPHPILGDAAVRAAISLGVNRQRIIDGVLNGNARMTTNELNSGAFACSAIQPPTYDLAKANTLLDSAGWLRGADGIRTKNGVRLRLSFSTIAGDAQREAEQKLIVEDMRAIGIEFVPQNYTAQTLIGTWDGASPRKRGNYDVMLYFTSVNLNDPYQQMEELYASWQIPSATNKIGTNYTRFSNTQADALLRQAAQTLDLNQRKAIYCQLAQLRAESNDMIYLFQPLAISAYRARVQGWQDHATTSFMQSASEWWIK